MTPPEDRWLDEVTDPRVRALLDGLTAPATDAELARETEIVTAMAEAVAAGPAGPPLSADAVEPVVRGGHVVRHRARRRVAVVAGVVAISFATAAAASEIVTSLTPDDRSPERSRSVERPGAPAAADDDPSTGGLGDEDPGAASADDPAPAEATGSAPSTTRSTTSATTTTTTSAPSDAGEGTPNGPPASPPGRPADPGGSGSSGGPPSSHPGSSTGPPADPGPPDTRPGAAGRSANANPRAPDQVPS